MTIENRDKIIVGDEEEEGAGTWNNCEMSKEKEVELGDWRDVGSRTD